MLYSGFQLLEIAALLFAVLAGLLAERDAPPPAMFGIEDGAAGKSQLLTRKRHWTHRVRCRLTTQQKTLTGLSTYTGACRPPKLDDRDGRTQTQSGHPLWRRWISRCDGQGCCKAANA